MYEVNMIMQILSDYIKQDSKKCNSFADYFKYRYSISTRELINLSGLKINNYDLSGINFLNINFSNTDFSNCNLENVNLKNSLLIAAILKNVKLRNANLQNVDLTNADLRGADMTNANITNVKGLTLSMLVACELDNIKVDAKDETIKTFIKQAKTIQSQLIKKYRLEKVFSNKFLTVALESEVKSNAKMSQTLVSTENIAATIGEPKLVEPSQETPKLEPEVTTKKNVKDWRVFEAKSPILNTPATSKPSEEKAFQPLTFKPNPAVEVYGLTFESSVNDWNQLSPEVITATTKGIHFVNTWSIMQQLSVMVVGPDGEIQGNSQVIDTDVTAIRVSDPRYLDAVGSILKSGAMIQSSAVQGGSFSGTMRNTNVTGVDLSTSKAGSPKANDQFPAYAATGIRGNATFTNCQVHIVAIDQNNASEQGRRVPAYRYTFEYIDSNATTVHLAGSFNHWLYANNGRITGDCSKWEMKKGLEPGKWHLTLEFIPADYEFKYVINGGDVWKLADQFPVKNGNSLLKVLNSEAISVTSKAEQFIKLLKRQYLESNIALIKRLGYEKYMLISKSFINLALIEEDEYKKSFNQNKTKDANKNYEQMINFYEAIRQSKRNIPLIEIFSSDNKSIDKLDFSHLLIEGSAGIGKSTLCNYFANQWALGEKGNIYPLIKQFDAIIILPLREIARLGVTSIAQAVHSLCLPEEEQNNCTVKQIEEVLHVLGNTGRVLYVIDGFDEIAALSEDNPAKIIFNSLIKKKFWILTSRPYYFTPKAEKSTEYRHLENIGFTDDDINEYIDQFFGMFTFEEEPNANTKAKELKAAVSKNSVARAVASVPINLELICTIWQKGAMHKVLEQQLTSVTGLFSGLMLSLYERFSEKQNIDLSKKTQHEKEQLFKNEKIIHFYDTLAWLATQQADLIISPLLYQPLLEKYFTEDERKNFIKFGILKAAGIHKNAIEQEYYFIHLTFKDFLAAFKFVRCLCEGTEVPVIDKGKIQEVGIEIFVANNKYDSRYQLIWAFVAGLLSDSILADERALNKFLLLLQAKPRDLLGINHLVLMARCLNEVNPQMDNQVYPTILKELCDCYWQLLKEVLPAAKTQYLNAFEECTQLLHSGYHLSLLLRELQNNTEGTQIIILKRLKNIDLARIPEDIANNLIDIVLQKFGDKITTEEISSLAKYVIESFIKNLKSGPMLEKILEKLVAIANSNQSAREDVARLLLYVNFESVDKKCLIPLATTALDMSQSFQPDTKKMAYGPGGLIKSLDDSKWHEVLSKLLSVIENQHTLKKAFEVVYSAARSARSWKVSNRYNHIWWLPHASTALMSLGQQYVNEFVTNEINALTNVSQEPKQSEETQSRQEAAFIHLIAHTQNRDLILFLVKQMINATLNIKNETLKELRPRHINIEYMLQQLFSSELSSNVREEVLNIVLYAIEKDGKEQLSIRMLIPPVEACTRSQSSTVVMRAVRVLLTYIEANKGSQDSSKDYVGRTASYTLQKIINKIIKSPSLVLEVTSLLLANQVSEALKQDVVSACSLLIHYIEQKDIFDKCLDFILQETAKNTCDESTIKYSMRSLEKLADGPDPSIAKKSAHALLTLMKHSPGCNLRVTMAAGYCLGNIASNLPLQDLKNVIACLLATIREYRTKDNSLWEVKAALDNIIKLNSEKQRELLEEMYNDLLNIYFEDGTSKQAQVIVLWIAEEYIERLFNRNLFDRTLIAFKKVIAGSDGYTKDIVLRALQKLSTWQLLPDANDIFSMILQIIRNPSNPENSSGAISVIPLLFAKSRTDMSFVKTTITKIHELFCDSTITNDNKSSLLKALLASDKSIFVECKEFVRLIINLLGKKETSDKLKVSIFDALRQLIEHCPSLLSSNDNWNIFAQFFLDEAQPLQVRDVAIKASLTVLGKLNNNDLRLSYITALRKLTQQQGIESSLQNIAFKAMITLSENDNDFDQHFERVFELFVQLRVQRHCYDLCALILKSVFNALLSCQIRKDRINFFKIVDKLLAEISSSNQVESNISAHSDLFTNEVCDHVDKAYFQEALPKLLDFPSADDMMAAYLSREDEPGIFADPENLNKLITLALHRGLPNLDAYAVSGFSQRRNLVTQILSNIFIFKYALAAHKQFPTLLINYFKLVMVQIQPNLYILDAFLNQLIIHIDGKIRVLQIAPSDILLIEESLQRAKKQVTEEVEKALNKAPIAPVFKPTEAVYPDQRPTTYEYALMSQAVYHKLEPGDPLQGAPGWDVHTVREYGSSDYYGACFINATTKQLVIAHKGTDSLGTLWEDLQGVVRATESKHKMEIFDIIQAAKKYMNARQGQGWHLSFTGHSLGGFLAELCVFLCSNDIDFDVKDTNAETFESPGVKSTLEALKSNQNPIDYNSLDIVCYVSYPNLVNTFDNHVGSLFSLQTTLKEDDSWFGWKAGYTYTRQAHTMDNIVEYLAKCFVTKTTKFEPLYLTDWPRGLQRETLFKYLKKEVVSKSDEKPERYRYVFPPNIFTKDTLDKDALNKNDKLLLEKDEERFNGSMKLFDKQYHAHYQVVKAYSGGSTLPLRHFSLPMQTFLVVFQDLFKGVEKNPELKTKLAEKWLEHDIPLEISNYLLGGYALIRGKDSLVYVNVLTDDPDIYTFRQKVSKWLSENKKSNAQLLSLFIQLDSNSSKVQILAKVIEGGAEVDDGAQLINTHATAAAFELSEGGHKEEAEMAKEIWSHVVSTASVIKAVIVEKGAKVGKNVKFENVSATAVKISFAGGKPETKIFMPGTPVVLPAPNVSAAEAPIPTTLTTSAKTPASMTPSSSLSPQSATPKESKPAAAASSTSTTGDAPHWKTDLEAAKPKLSKDELNQQSTAIDKFRYLADRSYTWRDVLNRHVFDITLTAEQRKDAEAIVKQLISKRDELDKSLYLIAIQRLLGDDNKHDMDRRYHYNRLPKRTTPKSDLTGFNLEYYELEVKDTQHNDIAVLTVSVVAPGSRDLTSDIDTSLKVVCHRADLLLSNPSIKWPHVFTINPASVNTFDIEVLVQAALIYYFNQLNCELIGQTSAENRDSNVYIDGFMHDLAFMKFPDISYNSQGKELSGNHEIARRSKQEFYQANKAQRQILELAASLVSIRAYFGDRNAEFKDYFKTFFNTQSSLDNSQKEFVNLMSEVLQKVEELYQYQQSNINNCKNDIRIQRDYLNDCNKALTEYKLSDENIRNERANDFDVYVNNNLYAVHLVEVARIRKRIKELRLEESEKHLQEHKGKLHEFDRIILDLKNKLNLPQYDEIAKSAFNEILKDTEANRAEHYQNTFAPAVKAHLGKFAALAALLGQQQEAMIKAHLFAVEGYINYSAPYHTVAWQQSGNHALRIDRRRVVLCSVLQQIGFRLLHAKHYRALGMEEGEILYRVAKYGQRVADVLLGDVNKWFGDVEFTYSEESPVLKRFKPVPNYALKANVFNRNFYEVINLHTALVREVKKADASKIPVHEKGQKAILLYLRRYLVEREGKSLSYANEFDDKDLILLLQSREADLKEWLTTYIDNILLDAVGKFISEAYRSKIISHSVEVHSQSLVCWGTIFKLRPVQPAKEACIVGFPVGQHP